MHRFACLYDKETGCVCVLCIGKPFEHRQHAASVGLRHARMNASAGLRHAYATLFFLLRRVVKAVKY